MCVARAVELRMKKSEDVKCVVVFFFRRAKQFSADSVYVYIYMSLCVFVLSPRLCRNGKLPPILCIV